MEHNIVVRSIIFDDYEFPSSLSFTYLDKEGRIKLRKYWAEESFS